MLNVLYILIEKTTLLYIFYIYKESIQIIYTYTCVLVHYFNYCIYCIHINKNFNWYRSKIESLIINKMPS